MRLHSIRIAAVSDIACGTKTGDANDCGVARKALIILVPATRFELVTPRV
jgi:hypothetical protein